MITDQDVKKLSKTFVTKKDLNKGLSFYSTKKDLKKALSLYATKKDLQNTNDRLDASVKELIEFMMSLHEEVMKRFDKLDHTIDNIISWSKRHDYKLENHEGRIQHLEALT